MKKNFRYRLYPLFLLTAFILCANLCVNGVIAIAENSSITLDTFSELIVTSESPEPVEIGSLSLEQAHKTAIMALEAQDIVLEYEASISSPDKRLICTPFLCKHCNHNWRFLILYQAGPTSRVIGYNLSDDEFKNIVEDLYQTSMYHFNKDEL